MSRSKQSPDKLSSAIAVLNQARASMLDNLADQVLSMADEFSEGGFQVNEFLEFSGSRLHFLCLMIGQFEMLRETRISESSTKERAEASERRQKRRDETAAKPSQPVQDDPPRTAGEESGTDL